MKFMGVAAMALLVVLVACSVGVEAPTPTQDLEATGTGHRSGNLADSRSYIDARHRRHHRSRGDRDEDCCSAYACSCAYTRASAYTYFHA